LDVNLLQIGLFALLEISKKKFCIKSEINIYIYFIILYLKEKNIYIYSGTEEKGIDYEF